MGQPLPYSSLQQVMDELRELVPLYRNGREGKSLEEEDLWETRADYRLPLNKFPGFSVLEYISPAEALDDSFPFILLAETPLFHFGTGSRSSKSRNLSKFSPSFKVRINEVDAQKMGLRRGPGPGCITGWTVAGGGGDHR